MWFIIHGILMHTAVTYFIGIIFVSISGLIQHKLVGEGLIDKTVLASSAQFPTEITSTKHKYFSPNETILCDKMQNMVQFFLVLLQVAVGDLNISKCACFTVFQRWNGGHATLLKIKDSHPLITTTHPRTIAPSILKTFIRKTPIKYTELLDG
jgi:hypothetical protein